MFHQRHSAYRGFFCRESRGQVRTRWLVTATRQSSRSSFSTSNDLAACNRSKKCQHPTVPPSTLPTTTDITNQSRPSIWDRRRRWGKMKCSTQTPNQRCLFTTLRQRWSAPLSPGSPRLLRLVSCRPRGSDHRSSPSSARGSCSGA